MKVLHISTYDILGGASKSCYSVFNALRKNGIESKMLVQTKLSNDDDIVQFETSKIGELKRFFRKGIDEVLIKLFVEGSRGRFSFPYIGADISKHINIIDADIINFHWINGGFFSLDTLIGLKKLNKPIVWTFHDMWAFTGGCHYTGGCEKFTAECKYCPNLKKGASKDFSNSFFQSKKELFEDFDLNIVTSSEWLAKETKKSILLGKKNIVTIPTTVNTEVFEFYQKEESRKILGLENNKTYILFGTMTLADKRKGLHYLIRSLKKLKNFPVNPSDVELVVFGAEKNTSLNDLPFKVNSVGRVSDLNKLARLYNASDVFIAPSLEDNLPNTVMESLSCGTPVVAFEIGGMPDMIDHKMTGYLAKSESVDDLTEGILWVLNDKNRLNDLRVNSRKKAIENFTDDVVAQKYIDFYKTLLK